MDSQDPNYNNNDSYNPPDYLDEGTLEDIYRIIRRDAVPDVYILTAVLSLLFIFGTFGNIVVICVFSRSFIKHTSTYFILTLSVVDLVICTVVLPGVLINNWAYPFKVDAVCKVWEFVRSSTIPISALTLMAIALDRYYLICMAAEGPLSLSLAKLTIAAIILTGISLGLPPMLGVGVYQEGDAPGELEYLGLCMPNTLLINNKSLDDYWKFIVALICTIFACLVVTYVLIFVKVYNQNQKWNSMKRTKVHPIDVEGKVQRKKPEIDGWAKIRRFARIHPARNQGNVFFVRVRSPQIAPQPNRETIRGKGDSGLGTTSTENSRVSRSSTNTIKVTESTENVANSQEFSYGRQRKAHIKTAKVLLTVTVIYILAYGPPLLISAGLMPNQSMFLFYSYFLHSAVNPIVYSFMNKKFRSEAFKLLCRRSKKRRW